MRKNIKIKKLEKNNQSLIPSSKYAELLVSVNPDN